LKDWVVTDIRWANLRDLALPFWKDWNKNCRLPDNFWQRIWEYPYLASRIPSATQCLDIGGTYPFVLFRNFPQARSVDCRDLNLLDHPLHYMKWPQERLIICDATSIPLDDDSFPYVFSISAIEEMSDPIAVLKEMIRLARHRIVVTMDVSDQMGISHDGILELEKFLGVRLPTLPNDCLTSVSAELTGLGQRKSEAYRHIRVLGVTIDARDKPKSVAILIPHWESWTFLRPCLEKLSAHSRPDLQEQIYVLDDASEDGSFEIACDHFADNDKIHFHRFERPNKKTEPDVGLLLDYGMDLVTEQYVAMIDADVLPLSPDWLAFPIWLIEELGCSSVGLDTGLSNAYAKRISDQTWWQPEDGYTPSAGLYDNEWFTCTNNLYRVMPTALARVVSENIGFTRATSLAVEQKRKLLERIRRRLGLTALNPRHPYLPGGCDNGVAANHFIDLNRLGPKFNIPLTSCIGVTPRDGAFGQNISGLLFHFALSTRALSKERREVKDVGDSFMYWVDRLCRAEPGDLKVLEEMIAISNPFESKINDGSISQSWFEKQYFIIQDLLKNYRDASR
jgi:hypothetical protein